MEIPPLTAIGKVYKPGLKRLAIKEAIEEAFRKAEVPVHSVQIIDDSALGMTFAIPTFFAQVTNHGKDNEITEAADVGFGSFYNYFDSKEEIYDAVLDQLFEGFADSLDEAVKACDDLAEIVAASIRYTLIQAQRDPLWGRLLLRVVRCLIAALWGERI